MSSRVAVVAAFACVVVALTGCAGAPLMTVVTHPVPTPTALQLTGTALQSALLPLSDFPPGYAIDKQDSSNSGSTLNGTSSPSASPKGCMQQVQVAEISPPGATAGVQQVLYDATIDHPSSYHQRRYGQIILQFAAPSGATAYISSLRSVISRCQSMTSMEKGVTATVRQTIRPAPPVEGHEAVLLRLAGTSSNHEFTYSAELFTADGTDVYIVGETVFGVRLTTPPARYAALTVKLIARVDAMS